MCNFAPFGAIEKVRNPRKITCESENTRTKKRKKWKFLDTFVDSGGTQNRPGREPSRVLSDFWRDATQTKIQRGSVTPPKSAKTQTPQNRRMYRGISTF